MTLSMTGSGSRKNSAAPILAGSLLLVAVSLFNFDLLSGRSTPFYRDLGTTQRPARALFPQLGLARINPHASFGQPYRGNPNFVLSYPFPRRVRTLGLHLLLHLGIGFSGAFVLFRQQVRSGTAALFGALAFGLSGFVVSSSAFLNATTTLAWVPWILAAVLAARNAQGARLAGVGALMTASIALLILGGEPALGALAILLAFALALCGPSGTRLRAAGTLSLSGFVAALVLSPWLLEVARASAFSSRRMRGFSFEEFAAVGFNPVRFLETPFPLLFGDPSRLAGGAFWGFGANQGNPPYHASLSWGVMTATVALLFVLSPRRAEGKFWIGAAAAAFLVSLLPWIPGARAIYKLLPFLHVVRYPEKALLVFTLSVATLAALGTDRLLLRETLPRFRNRAARALIVIASLLGAATLLFRIRPDILESLLMRGWGAGWLGDPHRVLGPIVARIPQQALLAAVALLVLAILLRRGANDLRGEIVLLVAAGAELLLGSIALLPRAPSRWYDEPSPLVARAITIPGRTYERTGKDLDPVRRGIFGDPREEGPETLALAQTLQGWALAGSSFGLRYAYDPDPDGSYSILNRMATDVVNQRSWPRRMKWLRAAGVGSVIASDVPSAFEGLEALLIESRAGIPATLFRVRDPLPGIRRSSRVFPVGSVTESVVRFEASAFDPRTDVLTFGALPSGTGSNRIDDTARARLLDERADSLSIETEGAISAVLHVDRSYTPHVRARVNGSPVRPVVADLHLTGIPVPAGKSHVVIELLP